MSAARTQVQRFLLAGAATVAIDLASYRFLLWAGVAVAAAKTAGFLAGTVFAFFVNRQWTFARDKRHHPLRELALFAAVYGVSLAANVWVNGRVLALMGPGEGGIIAGFLAATAVSATLNFLGMKFLAFRAVAA